jgi:hypothetical protein
MNLWLCNLLSRNAAQVALRPLLQLNLYSPMGRGKNIAWILYTDRIGRLVPEGRIEERGNHVFDDRRTSGQREFLGSDQ